MPVRWTSKTTKGSCPNSQTRAEEVREFVLRNFSSFESNPNVVGVAVNVDLDRTTSNSDIDVLIFSSVANSEPSTTYRFGLLATDVQWVDEARVSAALLRKFVDLRCLREIARVANSKIIWERGTAITRLQNMVNGVVLAPTDAAVLLLKAAACLQASQNGTTFTGAILNARGSANALSTLAVATTPQGYEKPKWTLNTLRRYGFNELADTLCDLAGCSPSPDRVDNAIESVRFLILQMCDLAGWPRLVRGEQEEDDYAHIYRTFRDAESLLHGGMTEDAVVTADYALRLCEVIGSQVLIEKSRQTSLHAWRLNRDRLIETQARYLRAPLSQHITTLEQVGYKLQETYKAQVRHCRRNQP